MWGEEAEEFEAEMFCGIAIRNGTLTKYEDDSYVNTGYGSMVWIKPNIDEVVELKEWFDKRMSE